MRNTANFYIRNVMTGLRKSPEERTANETEVLHFCFTGIHMSREKATAKIRKLEDAIAVETLRCVAAEDGISVVCREESYIHRHPQWILITFLITGKLCLKELFPGKGQSGDCISQRKAIS